MTLIDKIRDLFNKPDIQELREQRDIEKLGKLMRYHRDPRVRMSAFEAVRAIGGADAVKHLVDALECDYCRWSIASCLESIGQPAVEALLKARDSKDIYVQRIVHRTLERLGVNVDSPQPIHILNNISANAMSN